MNKIEAIKQSVSIVDIANSYGAECYGNGMVLNTRYNPLRQERTSSLKIYTNENSFSDFGSSQTGDVIDFVAIAEGIDNVSAMNKIINDYNIDYSRANKNISHTARIKIAEKDNIPPAKIKYFFENSFDKLTEDNKHCLDSVVPQYILLEADVEDKRLILETVRYCQEQNCAVVMPLDNNGVAHTIRYRYKKVGDEIKKWVALFGTKSSYPYCRLKDSQLTLVVEGTRDYISAILCGYSVIALPSARYKLDSELLNDRFVVFIDDDDGKNSMQELYEGATCDKVLFNHKRFKEITGCDSKDFSDYLYRFDSLEKFKKEFEGFIYREKDAPLDWRSKLLAIAKPISADDIRKAENVEWVFDNVLIKRNITTIVGAPNSGKTAFSFAIANTLLRDNKINTLVYFDADNPISYIKDRVNRLRETYGADRVMYFNGITTSNAEMMEMLKALSEVRDEGRSNVLVVVDSLKFITDGSLNDDKVVAPLYELFKLVRDRFGASVIVLHHTRKGAGEDGKPIYIGSQVIEAATDNMIILTGSTIYHKKSRSDKARLLFSYALQFEEMLLEVTAKDDNDDNTKDKEVDCYKSILEYLNKNGAKSQNEIILALNGVVNEAKIKKTLWDNKYKNSSWHIRKDDTLGWVFVPVERRATAACETYTYQGKLEMPYLGI